MPLKSGTMKNDIDKMISLQSVTEVILIALLMNQLACVDTRRNETCESLQYLELGAKGTVHCEFGEDFFGVFWYNTTDYANNQPILRYRRSVKSGTGYQSGEFDIHENGSLIINNVSIQHEATFRVVYVISEEGTPAYVDVSVVVIIKPRSPFPTFKHCIYHDNVCYSEGEDPSIQCSTGVLRPAVTLNLFQRTVLGDKNISGETLVSNAGKGYISQVTSRNTFQTTRLLTHFKCKALSQKWIPKNSESFMLRINDKVPLPSKKTVKYIERNSHVSLSCDSYNTGFVIWKRNLLNSRDEEILLYSIYIDEISVAVFAEDVDVDHNSTLRVLSVGVGHSGVYYCIFGNGLQDLVTMYELIVYVQPNPRYAIISGCSNQQHCVLEVEHEGNLTCAVKGIYPQVTLVWKTLNEYDADVITFLNQQLTVKGNDGTFDVFLTSAFRIMDDAQHRLDIECTVVESGKMFQLATPTTLLIKQDSLTTQNPQHIPPNPQSVTIGVLVTLLVVLSILVCLYFIKRRITKISDMISVNSCDHRKKSGEEVNGIIDLKQHFLNEIKCRYSDLCRSVQPQPNIRHIRCNVDDIFVECNIEYLKTKGIGLQREWQVLGKYRNIFFDNGVPGKKLILEGDPGSGKTTLTLQLAYDWCNLKEGSPVKDLQILILLRLRQLGGEPSIYRAIKRFILPKDTLLSETDIKNILQSCSSCLVILDGYDEYPDRDSKMYNDIMAIIDNQMFQDFHVITTTRSSFLPKKYSPVTQRIRLTAFNDHARKEYIRKTLVGENDGAVEEIFRYFRENAILRDLYQCPFLFALLVHRVHECKTLRNLHSVTSLFRYMISCFHIHMRNKMEDENVFRHELFENGNGKLHKMAFQTLCSVSQEMIWTKEEICQHVGKDLCEQYIRTGILVEEDVSELTDGTSTDIILQIQYNKKVRFYHKLFCEWYASHYLSDYLRQNPNFVLNELLQHLDLSNTQYIFRFACGINPKCSEIFNYIRKFEFGSLLENLCRLEQIRRFDKNEIVDRFFSKKVEIKGRDNILRQRYTVQLFEMAVLMGNDASFRKVCLRNCSLSVNLSTRCIQPYSGLSLSTKIPIKHLKVTSYNEVITEDVAIDILKFASMCPSLVSLGFGYSPHPFALEVESVLPTLRSRGIKVYYQYLHAWPVHILDLQTGQWKYQDDGLPTLLDLDQFEHSYERIVTDGGDLVKF